MVGVPKRRGPRQLDTRSVLKIRQDRGFKQVSARLIPCCKDFLRRGGNVIRGREYLVHEHIQRRSPGIHSANGGDFARTHKCLACRQPSISIVWVWKFMDLRMRQVFGPSARKGTVLCQRTVEDFGFHRLLSRRVPVRCSAKDPADPRGQLLEPVTASGHEESPFLIGSYH